MMIESTIQRPVEGSAQAWQQQIGTSVFALALMLLTASYIVVSSPSRIAGVNQVERCERLSGQVGRSLVEQGIAADGAELRRQKQLAFRACLDDYDAFKRLASKE